MNQLGLVEAEIGTVDSDVELTPPEVFEPLLASFERDAFDLDPCSNAQSLVPAKRRIMPPDDGLSVPWHGLIWCNPPYSDPMPWMERCAEHDAVALVKIDTSARWWKRHIWPHAQHVIFLSDRVGFIKPGESKRSKAPFPSALVFWARELAPLMYRASLDLAPLGKVVSL